MERSIAEASLRRVVARVVEFEGYTCCGPLMPGMAPTEVQALVQQHTQTSLFGPSEANGLALDGLAGAR
ncbi:MAG: hypothetical protein EOO56_24625 [Hymenobacter sp.]|nr:MAG: hypothetical protein EOO56_24625 [Hymenobacter sp.]